jgi:hypothetical protein
LSEEPQTPCPDRLVGEIDVEIARIQSEETEHGVTRWALLLALGTTLWLALDALGQIPGRRPTWVHLEFILGFCLALDALRSVSVLLHSSNDAFLQDAGRYHFTRVAMGSRRRPLANMTARGLLLCAAAIWLSDGPLRVWSVVWPYGFVAIASALFLILSRLDVPIPAWRQVPRAKLAKVITALFWGSIPASMAGAALSHVLVCWVLWEAHAVGVADVQFSGLVVGAAEVVSRLSATGANSMMLGLLRRLRRDLSLGKLDVTSAAHEFEVAVMGMTFSDLVQEDVAKILRLFEEQRDSSARMVGWLDELYLLASERSEPTPQRANLLETLAENIKAFPEDTSGRRRELSDALDHLGRRLLLVHSTTTPEQRKELDDRIRRAADEWIRVVERMEMRMDEISALRPSSVNPEAPALQAGVEGS